MTRNEDSLKALTTILRAASSVERVVKEDMVSYGLNATEFTVMEYLYNRGKQPIQMIGKKILLASSSITYVIDRLEEKGLVQRVADVKDRRVTFAELTDEGQQKMTEIFPQHAETIEKLFKELSDSDLNKLRALLKEVGYKATKLIK
ncbi:MarR family winged helix-turn-helix transcriptional regulator [Marinilactibacillus sp. Marseille-P9653]|uniref:MarR family winged helix-turn-helix transcriptional regulator n=1 Tax=Marinilactibacillus sp. Marseille-P9653 TaxID=2866583 RepID=UPI001CE4912E|nr:MarR family transcriptional regulator [Marinilactibacillus sp. Marseille-P9653]